MTTWKQRNGKRVKVSEMSDAHLVNAMRMVARAGKVQWVLTFSRELDRRLNAISDREHADLLDDCIVNGCDHYGSIN